MSVLDASQKGCDIDYGPLGPAGGAEERGSLGEASEMLGLGLAFDKYRLDHDGAWPKDLHELVDGFYIKPPRPDYLGKYVYHGHSLEADAPGSEVVLYEAYEVWPADGVSVLFADAHVERVGSEEVFKKLLKGVEDPLNP